MVLDYLNLQEYLTQVEEVLPSTTQADVLVALRSLSQRVDHLPSDTVEQRCVVVTVSVNDTLCAAQLLGYCAGCVNRHSALLCDAV